MIVVIAMVVLVVGVDVVGIALVALCVDDVGNSDESEVVIAGEDELDFH